MLPAPRIFAWTSLFQETPPLGAPNTATRAPPTVRDVHHEDFAVAVAEAQGRVGGISARSRQRGRRHSIAGGVPDGKDAIAIVRQPIIAHSGEPAILITCAFATDRSK